VAYPFHRGAEEVMPAALGVLEEIGGDDEVTE
jgi:transcription-repair coupling factor (superfamily II helicase)